MTETEQKICFLLNEIANEGYDHTEVVAQWLAAIGFSSEGSNDRMLLKDFSDIIGRVTELLEYDNRIWQDIMPGGPGPEVKWTVVELTAELTRDRAQGTLIALGYDGHSVGLVYDSKRNIFAQVDMTSYDNISHAGSDEIAPGMIVSAYIEEIIPYETKLAEWMLERRQ